MPYFALTYAATEDFATLRAPYRNEHLALVSSYVDTGELLLGGAMGQQLDGALLIFQCDSADRVKQFVAQDPYVREGIIKGWQIWPWEVVAGSLL